MSINKHIPQNWFSTGETKDISYPFHIWDYIPNSTLLDFIDKLHPRSKELNIFSCTEPVPVAPISCKYEELSRDWDNTKVNIIQADYGFHSFEKSFMNNNDLYRHLKPERHFFPMYWLYHTFYSMNNNSPGFFPVEFSPRRHFTTYNRNFRPHRIMLLDKLWKAGLLSNNYYSFLSPAQPDHSLGSFSHYYKYDFFNIQVPKNSLENSFNNLSNYYAKVSSFTDTAFQLVTETSDATVFFSEKIFFPILTGKPFVAFSSKYINKTLTKFGFVLYDNVFDYSFDDENNLQKRADLLVEELKRVTTQYSPKELFDKLKDRAEYNQFVAFEILEREKFVPPIFLEWDQKFNFHPVWKNYTARWYYRYRDNLFKFKHSIKYKNFI